MTEFARKKGIIWKPKMSRTLKFKQVQKLVFALANSWILALAEKNKAWGSERSDQTLPFTEPGSLDNHTLLGSNRKGFTTQRMSFHLGSVGMS